MRKICIVLTLFLLSACSFVKLTPAGENVAVVRLGEVANCTNTGSSTTVEVLSKVVINRSPDKVALELRIQARNAAADRGDTIVAMTPVTDGKQTFNIYRCRR